MSDRVHIVALEPIDQRYTAQWYTAIPEDLRKRGAKVFNIDGLDDNNYTPEPGTFLNFIDTNIWKAAQVSEITWKFSSNSPDAIKPGDAILFTDAWHFGVIATKYISELMGIPVVIHSIWHAGAYDPTDILGQRMTKPWPHDFERSVFHASDFNYYATEFHRNMFLDNLNLSGAHRYFPSEIDRHKMKAIRSGQPHSKLIEEIESVPSQPRFRSVVWPHRLGEDKNYQLARHMREFSHYPEGFYITQEMDLSKQDYYKFLKESKISLSTSLHENLGIAMMESCLCGCLPLVPNRASYSEMYLGEFLYPSDWTLNFDLYCKHRDKLYDKINEMLMDYDKYKELLKRQVEILKEKYLNADIMYDKILKS